MSIESVSWHRQDNEPLPQENKVDTAPFDNKRVKLIQTILDRIITLSTDERRGLPQIREGFDSFHFPSLTVPNRHLIGALKIGRFIDGLYVCTTTLSVAEDMETEVERLHELFLRTGTPYIGPSEDHLGVRRRIRQKQHTYHMKELNGGGDKKPPRVMKMVGVGAMAAASHDASLDLVEVKNAVEHEWKDRWKNHKVVTGSDLAHSERMRNSIS